MPTATRLTWTECPPIEVRGVYHRVLEAGQFVVLWDGHRATAWRSDPNGARVYLGYGSAIISAQYVCELAAGRRP